MRHLTPRLLICHAGSARWAVTCRRGCGDLILKTRPIRAFVYGRKRMVDRAGPERASQDTHAEERRIRGRTLPPLHRLAQLAGIQATLATSGGILRRDMRTTEGGLCAGMLVWALWQRCIPNRVAASISATNCAPSRAPASRAPRRIHRHGGGPAFLARLHRPSSSASRAGRTDCNDEAIHAAAEQHSSAIAISRPRQRNTQGRSDNGWSRPNSASLGAALLDFEGAEEALTGRCPLTRPVALIRT